VVLISVSIMYKNDAVVGRLKGLVIDRDFRPRWQFHELCDSESQELQEMGVCFCNDDGTLRYEDLNGLTKEQDAAASSGGFLQIEEVSISEAHRRKDLGVRCVKKLLEWLNARDVRQCEENTGIKPLYKCLRAGWTLAVLQPGLENTEEDRKRWREEHEREREGGEPSAADQAQKAERMALRKAGKRKVTQQWARLGFQQACFASNLWYVIPSRLGLKTKEEVSDLLITETPEPQPVNNLDKPLILYLREATALPLPSFEAEVRRLVASGADLNRCHVLIHAVMNGVTFEAKLRLLVHLGANPNDADEFGQTALHALAELIGGDTATREGAVIAANCLIGLGASCSVKDVYGNTPLETVLKQIRHYVDFDGAFGGLSELQWQQHRRDDEKERYELVVALLEPPQRAALICGVLTPRQDHRLRYYTENFGDSARDEAPEFQNQRPLPSEDMEWQVPLWMHIPKNVRGQEVYKSFVYGWVQVLEAIQNIYCSRDVLPMVDEVTLELTRGGSNYDNRYTEFFFRNGGKVEFAIDGLIHAAKDSDLFFDLHFGEFADEDAGDDYEALPEHPLDDLWDFVRYQFLGPKGKVRKGPFQ
jgi:hypothetical protein